MTPVTEILSLEVEVTHDQVIGAIDLEQVWPTSSDGSAVSYSLVVDGHQFDSFVPAGGAEPAVWDPVAQAYVDGTTTWDQEAGTVTISLPRAYLAEAGITAPYELQSQSSLAYGEAQAFERLLSVATLVDDRAPDPSEPLAVAAPGATTASITAPLAGVLSDPAPSPAPSTPSSRRSVPLRMAVTPTPSRSRPAVTSPPPWRGPTRPGSPISTCT